jgi:putative transposase
MPGVSPREISKMPFRKRRLSKSAVSKVTDILWKEFEEFQQRDLSSFTVEYLFCDAVYESLRAHFGMKDAVLCAWGITREGHKVLLHLALGDKESYRDWLEFLRNMAKRGLRVPTAVTTDGAPGLIKAVETAFSKSLRLRCWFHRMENFSAKVPEENWPEVKAQLVMVRDAASYEQGKQCAHDLIAAYRNRYPSLITAFTDDLDALLNHLKLPINHRKKVRTSNLVERAFEETRRRTKIIPRFLTEKSGLKLVYSVLTRAATRWRRIPVTAFDLLSLDRLREALGIKDEKTDSQYELTEVRQ